MSKYKLVPVEPTDEMVEAAHEKCGYITEGFGSDHADHYRAMITAAPNHLSNLEIVQKALEKSRMDLCCKEGKMYLYNDVGEPAIHIFESATNMLTWAKQTLGMEI